jgi:nucleoid-associated protein YgaU
MKAVTKILFVCFACALVLQLSSTTSYAQEMSMNEYKIALQEWADREAAAKTEIAKADQEIASLKSQIANVDGQTKDTWSQIYQAIGATEAEVNAHRQQLNDVDRQLNALGALSPEDLFKRRKELDALEMQLAEMKKSRISVLTEMRDKIAGMEGKIAQLRAKMPKGLWDEYTVIRGDYLWKISRNQYGEGIQWYRIYSFNKEQIKDPDLIFPEQLFKIHRESATNEYLTAGGDNLSKIAGSMQMMGDPTQWRALYDANKDVIGEDPSLIYPYTVLKIPGR